MSSTHPNRVLNNGHAYAREVIIPLTFDQIQDTVKVQLAEIPANSVLVELDSLTTTAFTNATTLQFAFRTFGGTSTNISTADTITTAARDTVDVSAVPQFTEAMIITATASVASSANVAGKVLVHIRYYNEGYRKEFYGAN